MTSQEISTSRGEERIRGRRKGYVDEFLRLTCAADVLSVVFPVDRATKEISEAMAMRRRLKRIVLAAPEKDWWVIDLCAGNGLVGALVAFTLPQVHVVAVDRRRPLRPWDRIERFEYVEHDFEVADFRVEDVVPVNACVILTAVHPCGDVAHRIVDLFLKERVEHLAIMPCCVGRGSSVPGFLQGRLSPYEAWCWHLASRLGGTVSVDRRCLSPRNAIVTASKPLSGRFVAIDDPMHLRVSGLYEAARKVSGDNGLQEAVGRVAELLSAG